MTKVFFDLGTNLGQGLRKISLLEGIDESWQIYSFEANPVTYSYLVQEFQFPSNVQFYNKGVWHKDCTRNLNVEVWPGNIEIEGRDIGINLKVGGASNVLDDYKKQPYINDDQIHRAAYKVPCIDFCDFFRQNMGAINIVKMDIEGAEFPILQKMIKTNLLERVDRLYIEFHNDQPIAQTFDKEEFWRYCRNNGVEVRNWD